jgi:hypothetical protein
VDVAVPIVGAPGTVVAAIPIPPVALDDPAPNAANIGINNPYANLVCDTKTVYAAEPVLITVIL